MSATAVLTPSFSPFAVNTSDCVIDDVSNDRFAFLYKLKQEKLSNIRPLGEFFDRNRFKYTTSFQLISHRWNYNLQYFASNYFLVMLGLAIYSVLTDWFLLFTIGFIFGGFYMISKLGTSGPINIAGVMTLSASNLYVTYACGSLVLLLFSGATGAIFWIIGASALLILGHAAVMEPGIEEGFSDEV
ncbi:PRA1 family protein-domain-containing protein [Mucor mucedo]|uniref:PRA1 family protein-domain-containing protein n=1 Tax=Mucor mucedo TaxID=29922 RepID=UPI0022206D9A|nr:PRA1 family protein-domain-containing protein [Mucor mucedo]KAI7891858.1 PRA1 family protein-domain-containing protein [Mucor mucedo]